MVAEMVYVMTREGLKHSLAAASLVIAALIVMPLIACYERLNDWLKERFKK